MATISFSLSGSGVVNGSRNYTVSDADVTRLISAIKVSLGIPDATNAQALVGWADWMKLKTIEIVRDVEVGQARANAASGISDINLG